MQIELDLPYRIVNRTVETGTLPFFKSSDTGSSFGDVKVGIAKTLVRERGWVPDLVGRVTWDTDTGSIADNDVALGIGFNEIRASLTALKRQDPLAFTATLSYENTFEKDNIEPGNALGISIGASLAASPETSLSAALAQSFTQELKVNGRNRVRKQPSGQRITSRCLDHAHASNTALSYRRHRPNGRRARLHRQPRSPHTVLT